MKMYKMLYNSLNGYCMHVNSPENRYNVYVFDFTTFIFKMIASLSKVRILDRIPRQWAGVSLQEGTLPVAASCRARRDRLGVVPCMSSRCCGKRCSSECCHGKRTPPRSNSSGICTQGSLFHVWHSSVNNGNLIIILLKKQ